MSVSFTGVLTDNTIQSSSDKLTSTYDGLGYNIINDLNNDGNDGISDFINAEKTRLDSKKTTIDPLYYQYKRIKHFKQSATKRNNAYWRFFMAFLLLAIIIVLLYMFRTNFPFIPSWVMDIILIVVVSFGFIYMFIMYENIIKRDLTDFDKLDQSSPVILRNKVIDPEKHLEKGSISKSTQSEIQNENKNCYGDVCCPSGTFYDSAKNQCVYDSS